MKITWSCAVPPCGNVLFLMLRWSAGKHQSVGSPNSICFQTSVRMKAGKLWWLKEQSGDEPKHMAIPLSVPIMAYSIYEWVNPDGTNTWINMQSIGASVHKARFLNTFYPWLPYGLIQIYPIVSGFGVQSMARRKTMQTKNRYSVQRPHFPHCLQIHYIPKTTQAPNIFFFQCQKHVFLLFLWDLLFESEWAWYW